jgi:hypothetical protein
METIIGIFTILGGFIGSFITYVIFKLERKDKFRMVAIEKRLAAHQEAFKLWDNLLQVIHLNDEEKIKTLNNAREFWFNNSLYLEKETRKRFLEAIGIVEFYKDKLEIYREEKDKKLKEQKKKDYLSDWERMMKLPEYIAKEVELEPVKPIVDKGPEG